jgi:hypothetical protein
MSKPTVDDAELLKSAVRRAAEKSLARDMLKVADFLERISPAVPQQRFPNVWLESFPAQTEWDAATLRKEAAKLLGVEVV